MLRWAWVHMCLLNWPALLLPKTAPNHTLPVASYCRFFSVTHFFGTAVCQTHLCRRALSLESRAASRERGKSETCLSHWLSHPGRKHIQIFYEVGGKTACAIYTVRKKSIVSRSAGTSGLWNSLALTSIWISSLHTYTPNHTFPLEWLKLSRTNIHGLTEATLRHCKLPSKEPFDPCSFVLDTERGKKRLVVKVPNGSEQASVAQGHWQLLNNSRDGKLHFGVWVLLGEGFNMTHTSCWGSNIHNWC